jgi:dipeptidase D
MDRKISHLQPVQVWGYFEEICQVPRPSKKEDQIRMFLCAFAQKHNFNYKIDNAGNLLITKPATPGFEKIQTVVLQSHLDMVCEKNANTVHDFESDPIRPYVSGDWVKAEGTTLGADCGIGIATQMAVLTDKSIKHGPIECLFTVDEETGLTGAFALKPDFFQGKILINLDSEDEGELFIGCAGGIDTIGTLTIKKEEVANGYFPLEISVSGLKGGHSGDDIHKGRANAIKLLTRFLWNAFHNYGIKIAHIDGGNLRNAIAREARAVILIQRFYKENLVADFNVFKHEIEQEINITEPDVKLDLSSCDLPESIFDDNSTQKLLDLLYACPHGVQSMSFKMPGMVETSTNLASVKIADNNQLVITTSQRSDSESCKKDIASMVESVFTLAGAKALHSEGYPGWSPNPSSPILDLTVKAYEKLFGKQPKVRSIHAGLECGLFLEKYPKLDMVSFGPTILGAHSPDERIEIETVAKFWELLVEVLQTIPEE